MQENAQTTQGIDYLAENTHKHCNVQRNTGVRLYQQSIRWLYKLRHSGAHELAPVNMDDRKATMQRPNYSNIITDMHSSVRSHSERTQSRVQHLE